MSAPDLDPQRSLPAPLWKKLAGIWSLVAVFVAAVWLWPDSNASKTPGPEGLRPVSCDARASGPRLLTTPIEEIRVFDWVVAENPYGSSPDEPVDAVDWADWRVLSLRILKPDGSAAEIELARPLTWVESQEATVGGEIWLDLPEMGIFGWAGVGSIGKCPDPGPRPSPRHSLVTATFKHTSDQVVRLQVSGEAQPLGVTASHPIWSVDRRAFVDVGTLDQGERVLGLDGGEHLVAALLPRPGPTAVYNLEVYGAHVYHVGTSGLLAHNMCAAERAGKGGANAIAAEQARDAMGRFLPRTGAQLNPGSRAVDAVEAAIRQKRGFAILGREISFRSPTGQLRRFDLVVRSPSGKILGIEIKSGNATRNGAQRAFDRLLNGSPGTFPAVGKRAAESGIEEINRMLLITVP